MFESIDKLIPDNLRKAGAVKQIRAAVVLERADGVLARLFGEQGRDRMRATVFKNGVVTVRCDDSVHAQEVLMRENEILEELNSEIGENVVERLRPIT